MTDQEAALFRKLEIFKEMDEEAISTLYSEGTVLKLRAGDILFNQGSESDALYILITGRLVALGDDPQTGESHAYGFIQPGEFVGEMGLISNKARSLTILAQLDATLFQLNRSKFYELMDQHPQVLTPILMSVIDRLQGTLSGSRGGTQPQSTMLVAANGSVRMDRLAAQMNSTLRNHGVKYILLSEDDMYEKCGVKSDWSDVLPWLNQIEKEYDVAIYICADYGSVWMRHCLQYAERVVIVGSGETGAEYDSRLTELFDHSEHEHFVKELVLLYENPSPNSHSVSEWIKRYKYFRHHHVVIDDGQSTERMCRFLTGTAKALVLAGGGTRGWVHIGAMRAFSEVGLEFDLVGGTSAGSAAAALYATGAEYDYISQTMDSLMRASLEVVKLRHYTLPIVSISDASVNTMLLQRVFGETSIEQLARQFYCVSCDISRNREIVHDRGLLWQAVRASCSVPGLAPPVVIEGDMHIDGGIINNMPVDIARKKLAGVGTVVAVDLSATQESDTRYYFPPKLSLGDLLAHKLKLRNRKYQFSNLGTILMGTIMASSERRMAENRQLADILIRPELHGYGMLDDARDELMQLGYRAAVEAL